MPIKTFHKQMVTSKSSSGEKGYSTSNETDPETVVEELTKKRKYQSTMLPNWYLKQFLSIRIASGVL